ncbi:hypothetical protein J5N97_024998 [Dioscorea zingiberensis]|uniref:CCHC-type domain-containing protein n=1 Tax=Dioscorea zingiberensis TaxID=325984 RepID=A0A9D5C7H0_9LILI|nr:hypothetical protein J5N97_024998 [Dioscorea zingiberensis]
MTGGRRGRRKLFNSQMSSLAADVPPLLRTARASSTSPSPEASYRRMYSRREGVTYVDALGVESSRSFIAEALDTHLPPPQLVPDEQPPTHGDSTKRRDGKMYTIKGSIESFTAARVHLEANPLFRPCSLHSYDAGWRQVHDNVLKRAAWPYHARAITCRKCGGTGHKGRNCRTRSNPHPTARRDEAQRPPRRSPPPARRSPPPERSNTHARTERPVNPLPKEAGPEEQHTAKPATPPTSKKVMEHHTSLVLDTNMMNGKEEMKAYTVATITKLNGGFVTPSAVSAELKSTLDNGWAWPVKEFRDGKLMIHCSCAPWTPDIWRCDGADGEIRWLEIRKMPTFCWNRDSAGKILKTIGDLIYVDVRGGMYVDDIRALVRVRRGRTMPCIIWTSIGSRKYRIVVGMERGQDPLPWCNDGDDGKITVDLEEGDRRPKPAIHVKRKAPMTETGRNEGKDGHKDSNQTTRRSGGDDRNEDRRPANVRTGPASKQDRSGGLEKERGRTNPSRGATSLARTRSPYLAAHPGSHSVAWRGSADGGRFDSGHVQTTIKHHI